MTGRDEVEALASWMLAEPGWDSALRGEHARQRFAEAVQRSRSGEPFEAVERELLASVDEVQRVLCNFIERNRGGPRAPGDERREPMTEDEKARRDELDHMRSRAAGLQLELYEWDRHGRWRGGIPDDPVVAAAQVEAARAELARVRVRIEALR